MSDQTNVTHIPQEIPFTIDGQPFTTTDRRQPAAALTPARLLDQGLRLCPSTG